MLALLALSEATFEPRWFTAAIEIADAMIASFADAEGGGFFTTSVHAEALVARRKDLEDSPLPSGNAAAALGLLRLAALSGRGEYAEHAESVIALLHPVAARYPRAFGTTLQAIAFARGPVREVALAGEDGSSRWPASCAAPTARASCSRAAPATCPSCWPAARPWTDARRPTCARASPAAARHRARRAGRGAPRLRGQSPQSHSATRGLSPWPRD